MATRLQDNVRRSIHLVTLYYLYACIAAITHGQYEYTGRKTKWNLCNYILREHGDKRNKRKIKRKEKREKIGNINRHSYADFIKRQNSTWVKPEGCTTKATPSPAAPWFVRKTPRRRQRRWEPVPRHLLGSANIMWILVTLTDITINFSAIYLVLI